MTRPPPDPFTTLEQHLDAGPFTLDLTKRLDDPSTSSAITAFQTSATSSSSTFTAVQPATTPRPSPAAPTAQHSREGQDASALLIAHSAISFVGFAVLLPLAAVGARWGRTRTTLWLKIHWVLTALLGIPVTMVGWILGPLSVSKRGRKHVVNEHQVRLCHLRQRSKCIRNDGTNADDRLLV